MNKREAIQAMLDGKKVRRIFWPRGQFICFDEFYHTLNSKNIKVSINSWEFDDWEIYQEPKKKVKYYRPKFVMRNPKPFDDDYWYKEKNQYPGWERVKVWEEIEVEE